MKRLIVACLITGLACLTVGCIEELKPKVNLKPNVWLKRGPRNGETVYTDGVEFEWCITDYDDDMGRAKIFVRLIPDSIKWFNPDAESIEIFTLLDMGRRVKGWMRWYRSRYEWSLKGLPDSIYTFQVGVEDARGADSILSVTFKVTVDNYPPEVDTIIGIPPGKLQPQPDYHMYVEVRAHDRARKPGAETPPDEIEYQYTLVGPRGSGFIDIETGWERKNWFETRIDGQRYKGEYTFKIKLRDKAGNDTDKGPFKFKFE